MIRVASPMFTLDLYVQRSLGQGTAEEARHTYLATADKRRKTRAELTALLKSAKTAKKV